MKIRIIILLFCVFSLCLANTTEDLNSPFRFLSAAENELDGAGDDSTEYPVIATVIPMAGEIQHYEETLKFGTKALTFAKNSKQIVWVE